MTPYTRLRRVKDAMRFIALMASQGPQLFEGTKSARVAETYGLETNLIKRMKARKRTELSFGEGK
jgi:hypothetical protein